MTPPVMPLRLTGGFATSNVRKLLPEETNLEPGVIDKTNTTFDLASTASREPPALSCFFPFSFDQYRNEVLKSSMPPTVFGMSSW